MTEQYCLLNIVYLQLETFHSKFKKEYDDKCITFTRKKIGEQEE